MLSTAVGRGVCLAVLLAACHGRDPDDSDDTPVGFDPELTQLAGPSTVPTGDPAVVTFTWSDPQGDVAAVVATRDNALGAAAVELDPRAFGITGTGGDVSIPIPTAKLPFGPSTYTIALRDGDGNTSAARSITFDVVGAGAGQAPSLTALTTPSATLDRPTGDDAVRPALAVTFTDADADVQRVRVAVASNGVTRVVEVPAHTFGISGTGGVATGRPLRLGSDAALGDHVVTVTLFDANGHASEPASVTLAVVASGGAPAPAITAVTPSTGAAGTEVVLTGRGFAPDATAVTVDGVPADVVAAAATSVTFVVPEGAGTGPIVATMDGGRAGASFEVPLAVVVSAESLVVPAGGAITLDARVVSLAASALTWRVDGVVGGTATTGTIASDGTYTAPEVPPTGPVTVSAEVAGGPSGAVDLVVQPPPSVDGEALVLAAVGGRIEAEDGTAALDVPAGALAASTTITVAGLAREDRPTPPDGRRIVGAVAFGPDGLAFDDLATVTVALDRAFPAGTVLDLRERLVAGFGPPSAATVDASGVHASASIAHFSEYVVLAPVTPSGAAAPTVPAVAPARVTEGTRTPIRLRGSGLTPDLTVEVLRAGSPTSDVVATGLRAIGDEAGLLLDVGVLADLGAGAARTYTLVLTTPEGRQTTVDVGVDGLAEWTVASGATVTLTDPPAARYSAIDLAGTVRVASGTLDVEATRRVAVTGTILAAGEAGAPADGQEGGAAGATGGRGGTGRGGNLDGWESDALSMGGHGTPCYGPSPGCEHLNGRPRGEGGAPGEDIGLLDGIVNAIVNLVGCVTGNVVSCVTLIGDIVGIVEDIGDLSEDSGHGRGGAGATFGGSGGGGGGAGEEDYLLYTISGGGGGAGGEPGRGVRIVSGGALLLDTPLSTRGGAGGDGSQVGLAEFLGIDVGDDGGFGGGGGGGGAGGLLHVAAARGVQRGPRADVTSRGGAGGRGGYLEEEDDGGTTRHYYFRTGYGGDGNVGNQRVSGPGETRGAPAFDPATLDHGVTGRSTHTVRVYAAGTVVKVHVTGEQGQVAVFDADPSGDAFTATLVLFPGFNTVHAVTSGLVVLSTPEALRKHLLLVATDTDADGLTDEDEAALGTDPANPDTDGDLVPDGTEVAAGTDPRDGDSDGDGLFDGAEVVDGLDPQDPDGDGDGFSDGMEVVLGADPSDEDDGPNSVPAGILFAQRGGDLMVLDPVAGRLGTVGRPAGGLGFGLAAPGRGPLFIAGLDALATADPLTATPTAVGPYGSVGPETLRTLTLAWSPTEEVLYGVEVGPSPGFAPTGQLLVIEPTTGEAARVGEPAATALHALAFDEDGVLYATIATAGDDTLAIVDPATGVVTEEIGTVGASGVFGLAFVGDVLWATATNGAEATLLTVDPSTGLGTEVGSLPGVVYDLSARPPAAPVGGECPLPPDTDCNGNGVADACDVEGLFELVAHVDTSGNGTTGDVVVGDVDGDTDVDVLFGADIGAALLENLGDGTFAAPAAVTTVRGGLALGDVDGDLDLDLLVADVDTDTVTVFDNDGFGAFTAVQVLTAGTNPTRVALADLDGDLDLDVVIGNAGVSVGFGWAGASVQSHLWTGSAFGSATDHPEAFEVRALAAADLDGDDAAEVVVVLSFGAYVLRNDGGGTLTQDATAFTIDSAPSIALADVTGDTLADVVLAGTVWENDGGGALSAGASLPVLGARVGVDVDADGAVDLLTGRDFRAPIDVQVNDGAGGFAPRASGVATEGGYYATGGASADFDGDGLPDAVYASYGFVSSDWFGGVSLFRNRGYGGFDADFNGTVDGCE